MAQPHSNEVPKVLHCHTGFGTSGISGQAALRSVRLMNAFGSRLSHSIVSASAGEMNAAQAINSAVAVSFPKDFPAINGWPTPGRLLGLAKAMQGFDLILTYGWQAMDVAMAHTVFGQSMELAPLIHHEGGFDGEEAKKLKLGRNWYRRIALGRAAGLVVPTERLEGIALETWYQPIGRVGHIADGIDTKKFGRKCQADALRRVVKRDGEKWVGAVAEGSSKAALTQLVTSFAELPEEWHIVILGEADHEEAVRERATDLDVSHRVHLPGGSYEPAKVMGLFDLFAIPSTDAQLPVALLQAMAAGLPIAGYDAGDVAASVTESNVPFIVDASRPALLGSALCELAGIGETRIGIGAENRNQARANFDEKPMIESYRRLYASALGREI